jgi:hypothetical protein
MAENNLNTNSRSKVEGFSTINDPNGVFQMNANFDEETLNVNNEPLILISPATKEIALLEQRTIKNGNEGIEGELLIDQEVDVIYEVDITGELILSHKEASQYQITGNSELQINLK